MKRVFFALVLAGLFCAGALATDLIYKDTVVWLPQAADNVCSLRDSIGDNVDVIVLYSASDIRLFVGAVVDTGTVANAQAAVDSLCGLVTVVPGEGHTFQGSFKWLLSPARTDTVYIDCYDRVNR